MKKIVFFSLLIGLSLWILAYVNSEKDKQRKEAEKVTIVESQAASSLPGIESSSSSSVSADYRLRVLSEPEGADVYVDSEKVGQAPVEIPVPKESQKLKLTLSGYDDYERQIPAARDSEGDLVWKIQLKKAPPKEVVNFHTKEISPFSIQIKAVPLADFYDSEKDFEGIKPKFCRVSINDNTWVRVVTGPYKNKKLAGDALKQIKKKYADAFLGTKQKCLKDGEVL
jgi:hypothetical protein